MRRLIGFGTLALALAVADASGATAQTLGFRNDTKSVLIVQETVTVNNVARRSKPRTLYPGEVVLGNAPITTCRSIAVFDPKQPTQPLLCTRLPQTLTGQFYSLQLTPKPVGKPPPGYTTVRLVADKMPAQPIAIPVVPVPVVPIVPARPRH